MQGVFEHLESKGEGSPNVSGLQILVEGRVPLGEPPAFCTFFRFWVKVESHQGIRCLSFVKQWKLRFCCKIVLQLM